MRIFDNPNHPQYGPVRRCWIVMVQLDLLGQDAAYEAEHRTTWDACMADAIANHDIAESAICRIVIWRMLRLYKENST